MQESVIYQDIIQEGIQQGIQEGIQQGIQEGIQQGIQEGIQQGIQEGIQKEQQLVMRLLKHQVGDLPEDYRAQVEALPLPQLETLGEALLDFEQFDDLVNWLADHTENQEEPEAGTD
ncbi:MAG: DUF4351 domain-containing protein [Cyanobacteria bacterium J06635_1]